MPDCLSRQEYSQFLRCSDFLWAVRCHLHFLTGRAEERLSFDVQPELAHRLGYQMHPGLQAAERFMKHYFLIAKDVGDLTRIVCAELEEREAKNAPRLNRLIRNIRSRRRVLKGSTDFVVEHGRINVADDNVFERDPVNLIRIFREAGKHDIPFHPDALRLITKSLRRIDRKLQNDPEANRLFLEILCDPEDAEAVLRAMNEAGVLGRFIPDFGKIVAMMQFNMYHHYTVDEHLIRAIGTLSGIRTGRLVEDHPLSAKILPSIKDLTVLTVALFLHDIAKGRPEDHSIAGAKVARKLCPRLGLNAHQTELVAWLVEEHLTMSKIAQSRDLSDRRTIMDFAQIVQTPERLKLLARAHRLRHPRRRAGGVERLEGPAAARALLRDRADPDRWILRLLAQAAARRDARRARRAAGGMAGGGARADPRPPLPRLLAARRRGAASPPRGVRPPRRPRSAEARLRDPSDELRRQRRS